MNVVKPALTAVPLILFLVERKWKSAFLYTVIYTAAFLGELLLVPNVQGFLNFILVVDEGRIVQKGKHRELIRQEGKYLEFVRAREQTEGWQIQ